MGLLGDFGAGFFADQAQQIAERRQLSVQEAIFAKRRQLQLDDEERRDAKELRQRADLLNAQRQPFQQGGLLRERTFDVSPEGRLTSQDRDIGPAPRAFDGRPFPVIDGNKIKTVQRYTDGSSDVLGEGPRRMGGTGGGSGQRLTTVSNPDGSKWLYDSDGNKVRELPAKPGKREKAGDRKETLGMLKAVRDAEGVSDVKNILRASGINPDSPEVLSLPLGQDGDYLTSLKAYATEVLSKPAQQQSEPPEPAPKPKAAPASKQKGPSVPSGARDGQVYEDDDGNRWRVSGGRMVPA